MKKTYLSHHICSIYICLMFILFPLVMDNKLFNVVETKRSWFIGITIAFSVLCIFSALTSVKKIRIKLNAPDYCMLAFMLANIFSYILTPYKNIALHGVNGRAFGLITILFIGISYCLVTRFCKINKYIFAGIMTGSSIVGIIGILNFFNVDPFGIYTNMASYHINYYISTLGHTNIYSSLFSLTLPLGVTMYIKSDNKKSQIFYLVTSLVSFIGLISGNSDSGYITIGITLMLIPLISNKLIDIAKLCFWMICTIILSRLMGIIYTCIDCPRLTDSLTHILMMTNYPLFTIIILAAILVHITLLIKKGKTNFSFLKKTLLIIYSIAIISVIFVMAYATMHNYNGPFANLLVWCDTWGSNRGFIWKRGFLLFTEHYNPLQIIFGCGPDSVKPMLELYYGNEMGHGIFELYDNVHNEYLQYLLTSGIAGFLAYIGLIICTLRTHIKRTFSNINYIAIFTSVVCYLIQSIVNINQAVTTPLFFIMLALLNSDSSSDMVKSKN